MRVGIYPGSFDPVTNGHLDIIERAKRITDRLVVAVAENRSKKSLFTSKERVELLQDCYQDKDEKIEIVSFEGLLSDYCLSNNISVIIRGVRSLVDFEYESTLAVINRNLNPDLETIFLLSSEKNRVISSNMVKELASYQGDVTSFVPQSVLNKIQKKISKAIK